MVAQGLLDGYAPEVVAQLGVLWGKSAGKAGGRANLLLSHLLDTAAVAEQIWDQYLAPVSRKTLDDLAGGPGRGRRLFAWLCGVHDCGKATPAFQRLDADGARAVRGAGLVWDENLAGKAKWRHDKAGGKVVRRLLEDAGWRDVHVDWVWPLVAGHHGTFPSLGDLREPRPARGHAQGKGAQWTTAQEAVVMVFTQALGFADLAAVQPRRMPSRAFQLQVSGFVVMADWIASDERHFTGLATLPEVGLDIARGRAGKAWAVLGLSGGWGTLAVPGIETFQDRFDHGPRDSQLLLLDVARRMTAPGLIIVEAPMGEGKTKGALAAAEVLAARFGADGVFVGMPTQATSDPMFTQVRAWADRVADGLDEKVALLHGKRMFNQEWRDLLEAGGEQPDDCYGTVEEDAQYGMVDLDGDDPPERRAPAEWFLGRHRGLLSPLAVGTIDQLLFAATRTKHVMLRMAGLAGKVVVLDEVHAADIYMSQFLCEGLRWLGQAGIPVILLSATLPAAQREALVDAYLAGATPSDEHLPGGLPGPTGYPCVTAAWADAETKPCFLVEAAKSWREDLQVQVEVLPEPRAVSPTADAALRDSPADRSISDLLKDRLREGGCALVIRNTVARAQDTYLALRGEFADDVRLLHGRLHARHRADRSEECLKLLGLSSPDVGRPDRLILVATQLAEQSFDVDADLLITDLAPIDLLLQRIGRLHRHSGTTRPTRVAEPRVVVTGFTPLHQEAPWILAASEGIYGRCLLLRTAALVEAADGRSWSIPSDVPRLVAQVYGGAEDMVPSTWTRDERAAYAKWEAKQRRRADSAAPFLLTRFGEHTNPTLEGLHYGGSRGSLREEQFQALVRDGDRSVEAVLVQRDERGVFHTVDGRSLGTNGDVSVDRVDEVLGATVRLPSSLTESAERHLVPLPGWLHHPWLRYSRALILDSGGHAELGDFAVRYDDRLGLVVAGGPVRR